MNLPVPFAQRQSRLPLAGRIRNGIKVTHRSGKPGGKAIDVFRFTARTPHDLNILADRYGGTVRPWTDPKSEDKYEVITEASAIEVVLPPDPLGDGPAYELWGGKGLERRCDGVTAEITQDGPDGLEWVSKPCVCWERQERACKAKLRLSVIIPEVSLRGVWRYDTGSDLGADELPAMVALVQQAQGRGLAAAELRLEHRQSRGGRHKFIVPVLGIPSSFEELVAGQARAGLPPMVPAQLESGGAVHPPDSDVVDAEIVDIDGNCGLDQDKGGWEPTAAQKARLLRVARARAALEGREPPTRFEDI